MLQHKTRRNDKHLILTKLSCICKVCITSAMHTPTYNGPRYVYFSSISSLIHIWLNIIDIFCVHIFFFVNPFKLPYWSNDIRRELVDKSSIISYFPSTFCPTLGHYQGRMYYKSVVTFVSTLLLCKNEHLYCCIV